MSQVELISNIMKIYTIYKATNTVNGRSYIGFDSSWPSRKSAHRGASKNPGVTFHHAIKKHGWDKFEWSVIYQSTDGKHTLKVMESRFIDEYNTFKDGYNSTLGGDGILGYRHTESAKNAISDFQDMYWINNPEKDKSRKHNRYINANLPEVKTKRVLSYKEFRKNNPEKDVAWKLSVAESQQRPETSQKKSASLKQFHIDNPDAAKERGKRQSVAYWNLSEEERQERVLKCGMSGKRHTPFTKKLMSIRATGRKMDPSFGRNVSRNLTGRKWYRDPNSDKSAMYHPNTQPVNWIEGRYYEAVSKKASFQILVDTYKITIGPRPDNSIFIYGGKYDSVPDAMRKLNLSRTEVYKLLGDAPIIDTDWKICIDGIKFPAFKLASQAVGLSSHLIVRIANAQAAVLICN